MMVFVSSLAVTELQKVMEMLKDVGVGPIWNFWDILDIIQEKSGV